MKTRYLLAIILSIVIILAMVWIANPQKLLESFQRTDLYLILIVLVLYFLNVITKAARWYLLVNSTGTHVPFKNTFPFYIIALALNNLTPGKIGGEPVRVYLLKKEADVPVGQGIASIFAEKIMDLIVITTMAVIGTIFILPLLSTNAAKILIIILAAVIIGIIIVLGIVSHSTMLEKTMDRSAKFAVRVSDRDFVKKFASALVGFVGTFRHGMGEILKAKKTAVSCISLTVIIWINEAVRLFIILLALPEGEGIGLGAVFIASSIASILSLALPGGAGNILGIGTVFIAVGMDRGIAGAASFLHVATSLWISVPLSVGVMLITGFRFSRMENNTIVNNKK